MRFVSLFAGAGGLDLGLEQAGWKCDYASDIDKAAISSLHANQNRRTSGIRALTDTVIDQTDVRKVNGQSILDKIGTTRGQIPLLAGGPPCQSWSSAGHQLGLKDPRGRLFEDYLRIAKQIDARWLLFENVRGLLTARGPDGKPGGALKLIRMALSNAGWQTKVNLLNAADYGVPQRRVRLILIGHHVGDTPEFPSPTHAHNEPSYKPWVTLGKCLSQLRAPIDDEVIRPSAKLLYQLEGIPPGKGVKSPGKRETTRPGGHWGYKQGAFIADLEQAARTITANPQQDWIKDPELGLRRLSPRECAAIQTFPASWKFIGSRLDQYRLIGNSVPPILGKALGLALMKQAGSTKPKAKKRSTIVLEPLPNHLQAAINYTIKDEARNGASRRVAGNKRRAPRIVSAS